jgi:hypothetical protein
MIKIGTSKGPKQALESQFFAGPESAFSGLEKTLKNPTFSVVYRVRLCARRDPVFMAQIGLISPRCAQLIRHILKGLT